MEDINDLKSFKRTWKSSNIQNPEIQYFEITSMIHRRSNSILKKIFLISVLEFVLSILPFFFKNKQYLSKEILEIQNYKIIIYLDYIYYVVLIYFIIKFYINFRKININSNLNDLSKNILKSRKSVYYYIISSLILFNVNSIVFSYFYLENNMLYQDFIKSDHSDSYLLFYQMVFYSLLVIILIIISFLIWIVYKFLYLKLIDKLIQNYDELNNIHF